jgi:hypothetical protein
MIDGLSMRRGLLAGFLGSLAACGAGSQASPGGEGARAAPPVVSASRAPAPAATSAGPTAPVATSAGLTAPVSPAPEATIGDVTCAADADCVITTRANCCDCCASNPQATSRAWLSWRDQTMCGAKSCGDCGEVKCAAVAPAAAFRAECHRGLCALRRRPT